MTKQFKNRHRSHILKGTVNLGDFKITLEMKTNRKSEVKNLSQTTFRMDFVINCHTKIAYIDYGHSGQKLDSLEHKPLGGISLELYYII